MNKTKLVTLAWGAVSLAGVTAAIATPPSGSISRTELAVGKVTDEIDIQRTEPSDFHIHSLTIDPGGGSGWHTHPGPEYSIVKAGQLTLERSPDCQPLTISAGQGIFIPGDTPHVAQNVSKEPAQMYVTYTVPAGTTVLRVDADEQCVAKEAPEAPEKSPEQPPEKSPEKSPEQPPEKSPEDSPEDVPEDTPEAPPAEK